MMEAKKKNKNILNVITYKFIIFNDIRMIIIQIKCLFL